VVIDYDADDDEETPHSAQCREVGETTDDDEASLARRW